MLSFDPEAHPQPIDIINMYRLALGREPEADSVIQERLAQSHQEWMPGFFASPEFTEKIYDQVLAGFDIGGGLFDQAPSADLRNWAATFFPLAPASGELVVAAGNWYQLFGGLFSDPSFVDHALDGEKAHDLAPFLDALREKHALALSNAISGAVESVVHGEIVGWALDSQDLGRRLLIELYVDDTFIAAAMTAEHRGEVRRRYGGKGYYGFRLRYDIVTSDGRPMRAVVKEAGSRAILAAFDLPLTEVVVDEVQAIRREIAQVRELLERVEGRLPALNYGLTMPLAAYDQYFTRYYGLNALPCPPTGPHADCALLVDATSSSARSLELLLTSLDAQSRPPREIVILHASGEAGLEASCCVEAWRKRTALKAHVAARALTDDLAGGLRSAARAIRTDRVIWCPAGQWLRSDAVELLDRAMKDGAAMAYADSDTVRQDSFGRETHIDPVFRTCFDYDLLMQHDYLRSPVAFDRELLLVGTLDSDDAADLPLMLALRLKEAARDHAIEHVPRILSHAAENDQGSERPTEQRRRIVKEHLARSGVNAQVQDRRDPLGALVPASLRVRRMPDDRTRVAIIIPTRDRGDLLEPCLASIFRSQPHNVVSTEIIVVDNQSSDDATLRYLDQVVGQGRARVLAHDGPFNWALMNNRAAAITDADVLIFLNNDTAVLSDDCWDEISSNVLRPDVGVLGARLLYNDGTIQHAGAVVNGWTSFSHHEGMRQIASNPGYLGRNALLRRVSAVTGACLATKATIFRDAGGFDAGCLPVEGNDTDYCLRIADRGYSIIYDPDVIFYHFESKSRGYNLDDRSRLLADEASRILRARWSGKLGKDPFYNPHFDPLSQPCTRLRPLPTTEVSG